MQTNHFLHLLDAELASCAEDLLDLQTLLKTRFETMEITNYVFRENEALLKREIAGVRYIRDRVLEIDPTDFSDTDALTDAVRTTAREVMSEHQLPEAVFALVERRVATARRYLSVTVEETQR